MPTKEKCSNPELSNSLLSKITLSLVAGTGFFVTPEEASHLEDCAPCREFIPLLFKKSGSAQKTGTAFEIIERAEAGDPHILSKFTKLGKAFLQLYKDDQTKGLFVLLSHEGAVFQPQEKTVEEFEHLE